MWFKQTSILCLAWGLVMFSGSVATGQELFGAEAEAGGDAEGTAQLDMTGGDGTAESSPLDNMEDQPPNDPPPEEDEEEEKVDSGGEAGPTGPGSLLLTQHTMQAGGEIAITPYVYFPEEADSSGGGTFTFSPFLGFFVIDNLELLLGFNLWLPFGDTWGTRDVELGFMVGARYIIDFEVVCLYAGGLIGPNFVIPDNEDVQVIQSLRISVPVGILVPLNYHVGLNVGMRINADIRLGGDPRDNGYHDTTLSFPMGYFGVEGFFNLFGN